MKPAEFQGLTGVKTIDMDLLKWVQRKAMKMIRGLEQLPYEHGLEKTRL